MDRTIKLEHKNTGDAILYFDRHWHKTMINSELLHDVYSFMYPSGRDWEEMEYWDGFDC